MAMRQVGADRIRIGDFIATAMVNGYPEGFYGTVETIVHIGPTLADFTNTKGETRTLSVGGVYRTTGTRWEADRVYRES